MASKPVKKRINTTQDLCEVLGDIQLAVESDGIEPAKLDSQMRVLREINKAHSTRARLAVATQDKDLIYNLVRSSR